MASRSATGPSVVGRPRSGAAYTGALRRRQPRADDRWHLDEMFVSIGGRPMYLWRAGDAEGEVPDLLVQSRRDKRAAMKLMRKPLRKLGRRLDQS